MISQERKENLLRQMQKLEAYRVIQNEMGRTIAAFNFRQADCVLSHFALDADGVALEYCDEGVFEGKDSVKTIINELVGAEPKPGEMLDMQLTTPMIEIADDVQTAKCLWWCPGAGAIPQEGADPKAIWAWGMLSADFILCGSEWKIWHLHYYRFIKCDYKKGWVDDISMINRPQVSVHPLAKPTTYHNPYSPYNIRNGIPCAPRPYATYTESDRNWDLDTNKNW